MVAAFLLLANRQNLQHSSDAPCPEGCTGPMGATQTPARARQREESP
jgi:hypothetical protein